MNEPTFDVAVLGDSVAYGIGDPYRGGFRGFAALVGQAIDVPAPLVWHRLAQVGARCAHVVTEQVPRLGAIDVALVVVGGNDVLRGDFDPRAIAASLAGAVAQLRSRGALVIVLGVPCPAHHLPLPRRVRAQLCARFGQLNAALRAGSAQARFIPCSRLPVAEDRALWSVDRLHPSALGHRALAAVVAAELQVANVPLGPVGDVQVLRRRRLHDLVWLVRSGAPWIVKRSVDLFPALLRLALAPAPSSLGCRGQGADEVALYGLADDICEQLGGRIDQRWETDDVAGQGQPGHLRSDECGAQWGLVGVDR